MYLYANENDLVESVHLMLQSKGRIAGAMGLDRREEKVFPRGPVVKTPCFQCRGCMLTPWLENQDPACLMQRQTIKNK